MPAHPKLSPREKLKIEKLYAKGLKPAEICAELSALKLTSRQVTQFLYKRGWTKRRAEIVEAKQQTASEILQRARQDGIEDFASALQSFAASHKLDAQKLLAGWKLVETAADASSLMRAKSLLLDQMLRFHGVEKAGETQAPPCSLSLFYWPLPTKFAEQRAELPTSEGTA